MVKARKKGNIDEELLKKYESEEPIELKTPYGVGYYSKSYVEDSKHFELDFEAEINVSKNARISGTLEFVHSVND